MYKDLDKDIMIIILILFICINSINTKLNYRIIAIQGTITQKHLENRNNIDKAVATCIQTIAKRVNEQTKILNER